MSNAYLRFPHINGELVTFVAEDDVWLAPLDGGRAWRVSADQVPVTRPRISPDGRHVAWTSTRDVEPEVHLAPIDGGPSRRLTYWGAVKTSVVGWNPDGDVLAISAVAQAQFRRTWGYAVPLEGAPRQLPYGPIGDIAYSAGGGVLLSSRISVEPAWWKRYRGGTAGRLWVDPDGSGEFTRILSDVDASLVSPMWIGGRIAFLSDKDGVGSLYSCLPDGSDVQRHTDQPFYARNASTDGTRIVYHSAGDIWILDSLTDKPRQLTVKLGGPRVSRQPYPISARWSLGDASPDHTGRASAVEVRGTVHWLTHRDGPARALGVEPGVRGRLPQVLGTTGHVAWVTDVEGDDALEIVPVEGGAPRRIASGQLGRVLELVAAPDGRRAAVASHDGRVLLVDIESGEVRTVTQARDGDASGLQFSPDSGWVAWSHPGPVPLRQIKMADTTNLSVVDVTPLRFDDTEPVFTFDGKYLAFLSERSFDPHYDVHVFDMFFTGGSRPYLVPLSATTPSPFAPQSQGRPVGDADDDKESSSEEEETPRVHVDVEGIAERLVPFPVPAARYSHLYPAKDGVLWMTRPMSGELGHDLAGTDDSPPRPSLERFDFEKRRAETLVEGLDQFWISGDGKRIVVHDGRSLRVLPSEHKADDDSSDNVDVDLSRIRVTVDPSAEWLQAYDEAGRLMRDHFWRGDMGGVDWAGELARYRPLVSNLGSYDDLVDLIWEVQGELGTSHAYVYEVADSADSRVRLGLLGADIAPDPEGVWRVTNILPSETSDPEARSPLRAPGVGVRAGDALLAVDGRPVGPGGPALLLAGSASKPVELTIGPAAGGASRRVVVVPLLDDTPLRYHAWVADRRAHVHSVSNGRVGYLHVPDMVAAGWAQLHRDLRTEMRRDALVVDVRENRGGHLSQLVVEKLARKVVGWQTGRDGVRVESYPQDAPRGPVIAVADEQAGSDGDIVNAAIKALGIGPVVGMRTWGGTIGIDSRYHLVDGTTVTQPRYATWLQGPGWGVENHGVDPDVEVPTTPMDYAAGRDPQLDTAIRLALEALETNPPATPPPFPGQ
ncbi:tricorn protease [Kibdelosporangium banguiense]|uniref:Tricorn protease homolog n=1 Tax=Kibdelosporangium banguiense TaxID=1365924 RepID=A0ABS4T9E1_9PSEU|nr:S41 family peptidase [Kibdelosporangium banguiense]MBP2320946.1 tricorn protease [Kibdelosporangium banguiense]